MYRSRCRCHCGENEKQTPLSWRGVTIVVSVSAVFLEAVTTRRSRVKIEKGLGEIPGKHGTRVVDRLGQLSELALVDSPAVVRIVLSEQDWPGQQRQRAHCRCPR